MTAAWTCGIQIQLNSEQHLTHIDDYIEYYELQQHFLANRLHRIYIVAGFFFFWNSKGNLLTTICILEPYCLWAGLLSVHSNISIHVERANVDCANGVQPWFQTASSVPSGCFLTPLSPHFSPFLPILHTLFKFLILNQIILLQQMFWFSHMANDLWSVLFKCLLHHHSCLASLFSPFRSHWIYFNSTNRTFYSSSRPSPVGFPVCCIPFLPYFTV